LCLFLLLLKIQIMISTNWISQSTPWPQPWRISLNGFLPY
jgi:hypothetical protein